MRSCARSSPSRRRVDKSKLKSILSYSGFPMSCEPIVDGIRATLPDAPRLTAMTGKQTR